MFERLLSFFGKPRSKEYAAPLIFTNTLTGTKELFLPRRPGFVTMYSCGPTVYGPVHIGNLRSYVLADLIARTVLHAGNRVRRVMNITDVGHLVGDGDEGEDKMKVGATREKTTPEAIAARYTTLFREDIRELNLDTDEILFPKATEYIEEDIKLIQELDKRQLTYKTPSGIYFDTSKFPEYGKLHGLMTIKLMGGARVAMTDGRKNIHDFALWRFAKKGDLQQWPSPWGRGNPGWSIECSAMSMSLLGTEIDIHTGGEDLASIHHNNEIAQSEGATGRTFVRYWIHGAFLNVEGEKMSKSQGNLYTLSDIKERGYHPLALRYLYLQAHYTSPLTFTFEALAGADGALKRLWKLSADVIERSKRRSAASDADLKFVALMRDDLSTPQALAHLWSALPDEEISDEEKYGLLEEAEALLGLSLLTAPEPPALLSVGQLPEDLQEVARKREEARQRRKFEESDRLRVHLEERGYHVEDQGEKTIYRKLK